MWEKILDALKDYLPAIIGTAFAIAAVWALVVLGLTVSNPGSVFKVLGYDVVWEGTKVDPSVKLGWRTPATAPKILTSYCEYRIKIAKGVLGSSATYANEDVYFYPSIVSATRLEGTTTAGSPTDRGENFNYVLDGSSMGHFNWTGATGPISTPMLQERCFVR